MGDFEPIVKLTSSRLHIGARVRFALDTALTIRRCLNGMIFLFPGLFVVSSVARTISERNLAVRARDGKD